MEIAVWRSLGGTAYAGIGGKDGFLNGYFQARPTKSKFYLNWWHFTPT
jgi:hypothetical protein